MDEPVELHDMVEYGANPVYDTINKDGSNDHGENAGKMDGKVDVSKTGTDATEMKKLKLFCVILLVMIIVSSVTIGTLIHTLMNKVDATEKQSDNFQADLNQLKLKSGHLTVTDSSSIQDLNRKMEEIEGKIKTNKAKYEEDFQDHSSRITLLEKDKATDDDKIQELDAKISQLDFTSQIATINNHSSRLAELESESTSDRADIEMQSTSLIQLETNLTSQIATISNLSSRLAELETESTSDRAVIEMQNTSLIQQLKENLTSQIATINDHSSRLAELQTESTSDRAVIEMLNASLIQLEANLTSQIATITDHSSRLAELETESTPDRAVIEMQNTSLIQLEANLTSQIATINDHSSRLSANSAKLSQLKNETDDYHRALDSRLTYLEDGLNCTWGSWTEFSTCSAEGIQYRDRVCESLNPGFSDLWCSRNEIDIQSCNPDIVNGGWSSWSSWSTCTRPCNGGERKRKRTCSNPSPSGTGRQCLGNADDVSVCNGDPCPIHVPGFVTSSSEHQPADEGCVIRPKCPTSCSGVFVRQNGTYTIYPYGLSNAGISVYCESNSDGVRTVIQRRIDGSVNFFRNWTDYKTGFGNASAEYWLGNDVIHQIFTLGNYKLKVILTDWDGETRHAVYTTFKIANEADGYRLTIDGYSGDAGHGMYWNYGKRFSTQDVDNDDSGDNCAWLRRGAWWYERCGESGLNGVYHPTSSATDETGIYWYNWHGYKYSLKRTTMMIQRTEV